MNDYAGAAVAAAETNPLPQTQDASENAEPARASIDRAFAALESDSGTTSTDEMPLPNAEAPSRFAAEAQAAWHGAPEAVKAETHRALRELESGLTRYQEAFEPLKPYFALAQQHNTTVHEAMERYTALDRALLSQDPREKLIALQAVFDHAGMAPEDYANILMSQQREGASPDLPLLELRRELTDLRNQMGGVTSTLAARQYDEIERQVGTFAETHPRLNDHEFADTVSRLLTTGMAEGLEAAYDMADRLNPAPVHPSADQTRKGQLSIAGAPASGSNPVTRKAPATARESLDRSFASLGLG